MLMLTLHGKSRLTFVDTESNVDAHYYITRILPRALIDCRSQIYGDFMFMQDGAPAHTAAATQEYLQIHAPGFISKQQWPPHSLDCNPMDYAIWKALDEKAYKHKITNIEQLKEAITNSWRTLSQQFVSKAVRQFCLRLQLVVNNDGAQIEHLLE